MQACALNIFASSVQSLNFLPAKYMLITSHLCYNMQTYRTSSLYAVHLKHKELIWRADNTLASKNCNQQQQHCARSPSSQWVHCLRVFTRYDSHSVRSNAVGGGETVLRIVVALTSQVYLYNQSTEFNKDKWDNCTLIWGVVMRLWLSGYWGSYEVSPCDLWTASVHIQVLHDRSCDVQGGSHHWFCSQPEQ